MSKKTIIIGIFILFFAFIAVFVWFYLSSTDQAAPTTPTQTSTQDLSPFGSSNTTKPNSSTTTDVGTIIDSTGKPKPILRLLSSEPIASGISFEKSTTTAVRFIERATGHIYETTMDDTEVRRISNTTIPKIYNAIWSADASSLVLQFLKDDNQTIQTFVAKLATNNATSSRISTSVVQGVSLGDNLKGITVSNDRKSVLFLVSDESGVSGITANFDGSLKKKIFGIAAREWQVSWPTTDTFLMNTKPTSYMSGYAYLVNKKTGLFNKIAENVRGLTTSVNKDLSFALIGEGDGATSNLSTLNLKTRSFIPLATKTLPEKCVWSSIDPSSAFCAIPKEIPRGSYPDVWYQGVVSFTDSIWKIDASKGTVSLVFDIEQETGRKLDITNLELTKNESYILFTDKTDLSYWSLKIN
ncbi:MAG: hypothetical protein WCW14_04880 [Candidatus Paceibacterota bacterium]|jgi:hypothetical protein